MLISAARAPHTLLVDVSPIAIVGVFALIVFHLVLGWKVHKLSKAWRSARTALT